METIENKSNATGKAINAAKIAHGAAQVIRGAFMGDVVSIARGATKVLSPKVIAAILGIVIFIILIPVLILAAIPQVLFSWGTVDDVELNQLKAHSSDLMSCYSQTSNYRTEALQNLLDGMDGTSVETNQDISTEIEDFIWLIAIDAVHNNQDVSKMTKGGIIEFIQSTIFSVNNYNEEGNLTSVDIKEKTSDEIMNDLGFSEEQKNWATLMANTLIDAQNGMEHEVDSGNVNPGGIPPEAFEDEAFGRLITEGEKYLGYPYVFGGSSPSTSFDCSGFICWIYTKSGVYNLPRTTAQGIFNQCIRIDKEDAKPGDLIFFEGTYNCPEKVTHVGLYVGNETMLHCGSPIQYASIESRYWTSHFYSFGRLSGINGG